MAVTITDEQRDGIYGEVVSDLSGGGDVSTPPRTWRRPTTATKRMPSCPRLQDRVRTDVTEVLLLEREEPPDDGSRFSRAWRSLPFDRHRD